MTSINALENLNSKLRRANAHLVVTTIGALDLQEQAHASNRQQKAFLAMLAHELRQPLAPINTAADVLAKITDAHPQLPALQAVIARQVDQLTRLIDDLLDASRVNGGELALQRACLRLDDVIDCAIETSRPAIDQRRQQLTVIMPPAPIMIMGDGLRLSQVFSNLLLNAARFTHKAGHITLAVRPVQSATGTVAVSIRDNGIGIDAVLQSLIAEMFHQTPVGPGQCAAGLGIGLTLVRTIVEMHGGSVTVQSAGAGCGSEFIVLLPACVDAENPLQA